MKKYAIILLAMLAAVALACNKSSDKDDEDEEPVDELISVYKKAVNKLEEGQDSIAMVELCEKTRDKAEKLYDKLSDKEKEELEENEKYQSLKSDFDRYCDMYIPSLEAPAPAPEADLRQQLIDLCNETLYRIETGDYYNIEDVMGEFASLGDLLTQNLTEAEQQALLEDPELGAAIMRVRDAYSNAIAAQAPAAEEAAPAEAEAPAK